MFNRWILYVSVLVLTPSLAAQAADRQARPPTSARAGSTQPVLEAAFETPKPPASLLPPGTAKGPHGVVGYDRGLYIATGDDEFRLFVRGRLAARWEAGSAGDTLYQRGSLPTARLHVGGHVFADTKFSISLEVASGTPQLRDAYIDQPLLGAHLRLGQFKRPFSRQQLVSLGEQQFTARAITDRFVLADRDVGFSFWNRPRASDSGFEWYLGAFTGQGSAPQASLFDVRPVAVVRVGYGSLRSDGYSESDLDGGPVRYSVAAGYLADFANFDLSRMQHKASLDTSIKASGLSLAASAYLVSRRQAGARTTELGFHTQLGYFVVPRRVEFAGRVAQVPFAVNERQAQEVAVVGNLYLRGHQQKWQLEAATQRFAAPQDYAWTVRVQTQLLF
jgi:phosphate-selective porin OprO and OprP